MEESTVRGTDIVLLYDAENHIHSHLLRGEEMEAMRFVSLDPWPDLWGLTPRIEDYIRQTGLHHLAKIKKGKIDCALMEALIERWRPETNTFHFIGGEATITLEDISYIYGLPVDGKAVTGNVWSTRDKLEKTVMNMLGVKVDVAAYLRGGQLSLPWIQKQSRELPARPTRMDEIRYARAYLFCLVASQLLTNNAGARGHAYLPELFEDFERYAWGPTCLSCIYRSLTRATRIKDRLRTITGPIQLIQIWAYSRMAVGRPMRGDLDDVRFDFPIFKMWQVALSTHSCSTTKDEIRNLLDTADRIEDFQWQPYASKILQLGQHVETRDRRLFRCTPPLVYYWIVEQHNVDRVYKQFGLLQPVPPPFNRWERIDERASKDSVDYGRRCQKFVDAWEARGALLMIDDSCDGWPRHNEEYFNWYRQATSMTSATLESVPRARVESALAKVKLFLQFGAGTIALMNREQGVDVLYEEAWRIGRKMQEFKCALRSLTALEEFNLQACINEEGSNGGPTCSSSSSEWSVEEVLKTAFLPTKEKKDHPDSSVKTSSPSRLVRQRTRTSTRTASSSLPSVSPRKRKARGVCDTEVHTNVTCHTLVSPYNMSTEKMSSRPNTDPDKILATCSYISTQELYMVLRRHWISTTIMDYWLSITAGRVEGVHVFTAMLASMRVRGWSNASSEAFKFYLQQSLDDFDALLFPVWHQSHFYLLVAYPRLKRWDYYNTLGWRKRHWEHATSFKEYASSEFRSRGWSATSWEMINIENCPCQSNSDDCGVFVMAIADHLAKRCALGFTQADMLYFRQKIVHDIYYRQLNRLGAGIVGRGHQLQRQELHK